MATTSIKQLESFDSGSNYNFQEKMLDPKAARSIFDLSHKLSGTMSELGTIYPIEIIPTIMGDSYDISVNTLLRALPSVVPLVSRQRLYIYAFYGRMGDYWNNFETFMKKGYSGNVIKKIPVITKDKNIQSNVPGASTVTLDFWNNLTYNSTWETTSSIQAESMGECMGLPWNYTVESHGTPLVTGLANKSNFHRFVKGGNATEETEISAIPFMMMLRIWRDYFTNKNYHINDRVLLPDDDAEFRLNDDGELISAKNNNIKLEFDFTSRKRGIFYHAKGDTTEYTEYDTNNNIDILHVGLPTHEYPKDRWTSALPFLQRGDAPSLEYKLNTDVVRIHPYPQEGSTLDPSTFEDINLLLPSGTYNNTTNAVWGKTGSFSSPGTDGGIRLNENTVKIDIKMSDIRALAIEQTELEKEARTDGSYREFGLTFFGIVSKNATDHKPVYIGGSYQEINYTEVVQTSETNNTPMGSYTGHSTEVLNGNLGHIDCDDYGYIMILACIMPDVLYSEGLEDHWTNLYQSQMYLPERARIGMTNLLNKSIRFDYDDSTSATDYNEGLFAYQNYGDEYRYLPNRVKGHLAEGWNKSFFPYTQSRVLGGNVNWGREFAIADKDNVRRDYLQAPDEPAFTYDMKLDIRAVRPIPYKPVPANLTGLA